MPCGTASASLKRPVVREEPATKAGTAGKAGAMTAGFVTLTLGGQLCGLPVLAVRDVLAGQIVAPIPLAPEAVAGNLNLRGRIVTAINLRRVLHLPPAAPASRAIAVVTEHEGELYALMVDQVHEVATLAAAGLEPNPPTLPAIWAAHSRGIHRVAGQLMVALDLATLLRFDPELPA